MQAPSSYRPHNPGHDYYERGIYLITLVVTERQRLLSRLNDDARHPAVVMSEIGEYVCQQWKKTEALQLAKGNKIRILAQVAMPDHWHGVVEVQERMTWSLGAIIQAVKSSCTSFYRGCIGYKEPPLTVRAIRHMSHEDRLVFYSRRPVRERPLFDADYDDTICLTVTDPITGVKTYDPRHLQAMINYVNDNPRRAIIRHLRPDFMQKCLHIRIAGRDFAAFGNLFLLRWSRKMQVFCHRRASDGTPYEQTAAFAAERDNWIESILAGATVLVTPGISAGERIMKNECLTHGYPLIHLQKEPIGAFWKPEKQRFDACSRGSLLILAPWQLDNMGEVKHVPSNTDYSRFHNLNTLAAEICDFNGDARIV